MRLRLQDGGILGLGRREIHIGESGNLRIRKKKRKRKTGYEGEMKWQRKRNHAHPRFSRLVGAPGGAFPSLVGKCTLVISPTASKKRRKDSGVVLYDKFPTQMEFSRLRGREPSPSFFSFFAGDSVGRAFFSPAFLSFRFAAWESTGTSSVPPASELEEESGDASLFRFVETARVDTELTDDDDDDISLASGIQDKRANYRLGPYRTVGI